jgi:hypothetical protein
MESLQACIGLASGVTGARKGSKDYADRAYCQGVIAAVLDMSTYCTASDRITVGQAAVVVATYK